MLTIRYRSAFKKDYRRIVKRGFDVTKLEEVVSFITDEILLPE